MANQEQVALLKQGSEVWNAWRKENPDVKIDLSFADLKSANLISLVFPIGKLMHPTLDF
jgi:hypothetical protein